MRYWAHMNGQVTGPFEKENLAGLEGFEPSSLIIPETPEEGAAAEWKAASAFPEVVAALNSPKPAAQPVRPPMESLAMTMRGTLIEEPEAAAPVPAAQPARPSMDSLALTMRGSIIEAPGSEEPGPVTPPAGSRSGLDLEIFGPAAAPVPALHEEAPSKAVTAPSGSELAPQLRSLREKIENLGGLLASARETQAQLLAELDRIAGDLKGKGQPQG